MSAHQPPTDRAAVDDLLGESRLRRSEQAALVDLLASLTTPADPAELQGEAAALAAFRAAFPPAAATVAAPAAASRSRLRARVARALSIKAAVAALTVAGMGGVAVAASTGSLPGPIDAPWHKPTKVQPEPPTQPGTSELVVPPVAPGSPPAAGANPSEDQPAGAPPGRGVSGTTPGAEQRERVHERNAQRKQEHREQLAAEREAREARQAQRRAQQAEKRKQLTDRQGDSAQSAPVDRDPELSIKLPTVPKSQRGASTR